MKYQVKKNLKLQFEKVYQELFIVIFLDISEVFLCTF